MAGAREPTLPEVAFGGRSNVGKSSLLNRLVHRKKFARVSNTPGRTREINFFKVNDAFILVDLPGYGYARISKRETAEWRPLIEGYLRSSRQLRGIVQLLDVRHDPTKDDRAMLDFLGEIGVPTIVVLTKIDKLKPTQRGEARRTTSCRDCALDADQMIPFSAETGEGRDELAEAVDVVARSSRRGAPHRDAHAERRIGRSPDPSPRRTIASGAGRMLLLPLRTLARRSTHTRSASAAWLERYRTSRWRFGRVAATVRSSAVTRSRRCTIPSTPRTGRRPSRCLAPAGHAAGAASM